MPAWSVSAPVANQTPGWPSIVWNNEVVPTTGAPSISVAVSVKRGSLPSCASVEVLFAANPGAFAVDVQVADTNEDKYYVTKTSLNTGLNATFAGRIEITNLVAKFVRLKMLTLTNAVAVTARIF